MGKIKKFGSVIIKIIMIIFTILGFIQTAIYFCGKQYKQDNEITIYDYDSQKFIKNNLSNKIKVYYQDSLVENLYYKSFTIKNTGIKPINPNDYIENMCIETNNNTILDAQIISYSNSYIKQNIMEKTKIEENKICFPNILLNSNDYFQINVITQNALKGYNIIGVVSGINKFNINSSNTRIYKLNKLKKIGVIVSLIFIPLILFMFGSLLIEQITYKQRTKKCMKIFNCSERIAELFSTYYFEKIKSIKKNSENIEKDLKIINKEVQDFINDIQKTSDKE